MKIQPVLKYQRLIPTAAVLFGGIVTGCERQTLSGSVPFYEPRPPSPEMPPEPQPNKNETPQKSEGPPIEQQRTEEDSTEKPQAAT